MKKANTRVLSKVGTGLLAPPHILPVLMELLEGDSHNYLSQQEQIITHLLTCHYCRTAIVLALNIAQEYDRRNHNSEKPARDLLMRFASISREIEACKLPDSELIGAYAETIIAEGRKKADRRFHILGEHIKRCRSCKSALEDTLNFLKKLAETE